MKKHFLLVIFLLVANVLYTFANLPFYRRTKNIPSNSISLYQHHDVTMDYFLYISFIRESKDGAWRVPDLYTTETSAETSNYIYFILLGKIAAFLKLSPIAIYHFARIVQFELFVISVYLLSKLILGAKLGFAASLIALTAGPPAAFFNQIFYGINYLGIPGWWMLTAFRRADMLPHHSASLVLVIWEIYFFLQGMTKKNINYIIIASVFGFLSSLMHPISALILIAIQPAATIIYLIGKYINNKKIDKFIITAVILASVTSGLAIFVVRHDIVSTFPYNMWLGFDLWWYERYQTYTRDFILAGGLVMIMALWTALYTIIKPNNFKTLLISVWAFMPYILILFNVKLGIAKFRFALLGQYIPLAILAVIFVNKAAGYLKNITLKYLFIAAFVIVYMAIAIPSNIVFYHDMDNRAQEVNQGTYISKDEFDAIEYIKKNAGLYPVIFSNEISGAILPALASVKTYIGNYLLTINYEEKKYLPPAFFSGNLTQAEASDLILKNGIDYIYFGPRENLGFDINKYNIPIKSWYEKGDVAIYAVNY